MEVGMSRVISDSIVSHWSQRIEGLQASAQGFYEAIVRTLSVHNLTDVKTERVDFREGGLLSAKREYLQVRRGEHVYHICAAPYGNGFFVSSWLGSREAGFLAWLSQKPVIGLIVRAAVKPLTYFRIDTAIMFQSIVHSAMLSVIDEFTTAKGLRMLSEIERKPVMRDFFGR
jgi:hypothetical protein